MFEGFVQMLYSRYLMAESMLTIAYMSGQLGHHTPTKPDDQGRQLEAKSIHTVWEVICLQFEFCIKEEVTKLSSIAGSAQQQNHTACIATCRLLRYSRPAGRGCRYLTHV
jgi:hypothetical protein